MSLNVLKTLPSSRIDKRFEEGSPEDMEILQSYFKAAARQLAGINTRRPVDFTRSLAIKDCSPESIESDDSNQVNLLETILSTLEAASSDNFRLRQGLKWPGKIGSPVLPLFVLRWIKSAQSNPFDLSYRYDCSKCPWTVEKQRTRVPNR